MGLSLGARGRASALPSADPTLKRIVDELTSHHKCHTIILYGSRARGDFTAESDYDVLGIRAAGRKFRIARKERVAGNEAGVYLDIFVCPENEFKRVGEQHLHFRTGQVLVQKQQFGSRLIRRLQRAHKRAAKPLPEDEIVARKVWAQKMLERARRGDNEGNYRRAWLTMALLEDYFLIRKMRFEGSKASLKWLAAHDRAAFLVYERLLRRPTDLRLLEKMVKRAVTER